MLLKCAGVLAGMLAVATVLAARDYSQINPSFPRLANCYGAGLSWRDWDQGKDYWSNLDLVIGGCFDVHYDWDNERWARLRPRLESNIARLRAVNPNVLVLPYVDVIEGVPSAKIPDAWWDRNAQGEKWSGWPGMDRVNMKLPEVLQYNLDKVRTDVMGPECFDGVFYDCWSPDEWLVPRTAKLRDGQAIVMLNAWNIPRTGFASLNGVLAEDEINRVMDGNVDFEDFLARYLRWSRESRKPVTTTIVCRPQIINDDPWRWSKLTPEQRRAEQEKARTDEQPMRFGLTTTLLGDGYFAYDSGTMGRGTWWWYKEFDAPLGYPKGEAKRHEDGTWWREFDGGTVVVNGSAYDAVVAVPRNSRDLSTGRVGKSFTVPMFDGRLLLPSDEPPTPGPDVIPRLTRQPSGQAVEATVLPDGKTMLRTAGGLEVRVEPNGTLPGLMWRGETLLRGGTPVVATPPFRTFRLEEAAISGRFPAADQLPAATSTGLVSRGVWTFEQQRAAVTERLTLGPGDKITLRFECEALTALDIRMWRHYWALPVALYSGAQAAAEGKTLALPATFKDTDLLPATKTFTVTDQQKRVTIQSSVPLTLIDHRRYNTDEYLLAGYPVNGKVAPGAKWEVEMTVSIKAL